MQIAGRAEASAIWFLLNLLELCAKVRDIKRREI